jgi:hypothetical protein
VFDFAVLAIGRADKADRIAAVALNFGKRFAFDGYQISKTIAQKQIQNTKCMATNEIKMAAD